MQDKNQSFEDFSKRTERLAFRLGKNVSELPEFIGISASMMHGYRSGKQPISLKAWRKLKEAENKIEEKTENKTSINYEVPEPYGIKILRDKKTENLSQQDRIELKLDTLLRHLGVEWGKEE